MFLKPNFNLESIYDIDIVELKKMGVKGAIIGKAYYIGAIDLKTAVKEMQ